MSNAPLCALVHETALDPRRMAGSARACLADIRMVLIRHGFDRAANGVLLASLAVEEDLRDLQAREAAELRAAG